MLSIGKLATGQADYYLEQAHGSVTRAGGRQLGRRGLLPRRARGAPATGSAPARRRSGSRGTVDATRAAIACSPASIPRPASRSGASSRRGVPGFDLTFSAPKSVSVLFGIGDDELRAVLRDAHDRAVDRRARLHGARGGGDAARARRRARDRGQRASSRPRSGIGRRAPAIRSCTRTSSSPTSRSAPTGVVDARRPAHLRARQDGRLPLRGAAAQRCSRASSASSGRRCATASPTSPACRRRCCGRSAAGAPRSRPSSSAAARRAPRRRRSPRSRPGARKDYRVTPEQLVPEWRERAAQLGLTPERRPRARRARATRRR